MPVCSVCNIRSVLRLHEPAHPPSPSRTPEAAVHYPTADTRLMSQLLLHGTLPDDLGAYAASAYPLDVVYSAVLLSVQRHRPSLGYASPDLRPRRSRCDCPDLGDTSPPCSLLPPGPPLDIQWGAYCCHFQLETHVMSAQLLCLYEPAAHQHSP